MKPNQEQTNSEMFDFSKLPPKANTTSGAGNLSLDQKIASLPQEEITPQKKGFQAIRTYASDMASAIKDGQGSVVKIAMAEHKKRETELENASPESKKNIFFIVGALAYLVLGIAGFLYFFAQQTPPSVQINQTVNSTSLIFSESVRKMDVSSLSREQLESALQQEIKTAQIRLDTIENVYMINGATGSVLQTAQFFSQLKTSAPDALVRSLKPSFMFGIYNFDTTQPFLILKTTSRDIAFAGMLEWESKLFDDIYGIFNIDVSGNKKTLFEKKFQDALIKNRDARILRDDKGDIVLFYVFTDDTTIVITKDPKTLEEVVDRLNLKK